MEMKKFNPNVCHACKNQKTGKYIQCPYEIKSNYYCGKHKNYKYETYLEVFRKNQNDSDSINFNNNIDKDKSFDTKDYNIDVDDKENLDKLHSLDIISKSINSNNKIKKKLKLSMKNNEIFDRMLKNRNIFLDIQKDTKLITILDYFFNPELENLSITKIQNTFKIYKLKFLKSEIIELIKINRVKSIDNKKKIKEKRISYTKLRLKSLFDTIFMANLHIDKLIMLQKNIKIYLIKKKIKYRGLAVFDRTLCVNETDFSSLDPLTEIDDNNFYSYMDKSKFIYGFHLDSIYELFKRKKGKIRNPYTRDFFPDKIRKEILNLKRMNKIENNDNQQKLCLDVMVKFKCIDVFSKIDLQGYQTNINWLYNTSNITLKHFYKRLLNYWNHKLGMSRAIKNKILPGGDIINSNANLVRSSMNKHKLLDKILDILNLLVSSAEDNNDRNLGCILILHALSEINSDCINANPWLR